MTQTCVGLLGASGENGTSILEALLKDSSFTVIALVRPTSISKPANVTIKEKGVEVRALDLEASEDLIVAALKGVDILISAIGPRDTLAQIPLVKAASKVGLARFVPCAFAPPVPVGVHRSRDQKEEVFNLTKQLHIPYTILDCGWWYQFTLPPLPSGLIDYALTVPMKSIPGDGNVPSALIDIRDIGKYVVRAIKDERTLNKMVFCYNEMRTTNAVYDQLEKLSGEKLDRGYATMKDYERIIQEADARLDQNPQDLQARSQKVLSQYYASWGIRGENTPDFAKYLGYLDGKDLYPDIAFHSFDGYVQEVLNGTATRAYDETRHRIGLPKSGCC